MFKNKTVFISGGTGYLGEAICRKCAEYGAKIIFSYNKSINEAQKIINEIKDSESIQINIRDLKDIKIKTEQVFQKTDHIDILINNAGTSQVMPFSLLEEDDLDLLLDVNVKGTVFITKEIVRKMIRQKKGSIVNIGSIAGQRIFDVPVHYAISKAAISGFTLSLASELRRFNIRVNSVIPGMLFGGVSKGIPDELREDYLAHNLVGRPGTGEEVAEVVCFLASERASYVNGQNIFVDGGI